MVSLTRFVLYILFPVIIFMKVDYGKIISKAFHFSYQPRRWLPLFVVDAAFILIALAVFMSNTDLIISMVTGSVTEPVDMAFAASILNVILALGLFFVVFMVIRLWVTGALIHQSYKEKEAKKSWVIARKRLITIIIVTILTGIIGVIGGLIPVVGWLVSLVIGWIFFLVFQAVIIDNLGAIESMRKSYQIFAKRPFEVFAMWLILIIISISITVIFAIPLLASFMGSFITLAMAEAASSESMMFLALALQDNLLMGAVLGLVALVGVDISTVLTLKAQTEFYLQTGKK
jgi:hypothetical protein